MPMQLVDKAADSSEFTEESFWQHGPEVNERFTARWIEVMPEDKPPPDMRDFLDFMARDLRSHRVATVEAAQDHESKLGGDSHLRTERDEAHAELNSAYLDMRTIVETIHGRDAARQLGFSYPRSEHPFRFRRQTAAVIRRFKALPRETPISAPQGKEQLALTPGAVLDVLEPPYDRLKAVLKRILEEIRKAQKSQNVKAEAYEAQIKRYSTHAKCGEMIYRMVGLDKFADQIKPSTRRPGQRAADEEAEDDPPSSGADAADGGPPPAADAADVSDAP